MTMHHDTRGELRRPSTPGSEPVLASLAAEEHLVTVASTTVWWSDGHDRDQVHDAALESFPASDPPSWSALRAGPPSDY